MYPEFEKRNTVVIAVAQEDKDLASHARFLEKFKTPIPFPIVADVGRKQTEAYKQTTAYLIDRKGIVRQIFPMMVHHRASWKAILNEIDRISAGS